MHRRAGHPRATRRPALADFVHRSSRACGACARRARSPTACCRRSSAIERAIRGGVRRVHVISYSQPDSLLAEMFTNEGTGTLVVADTKRSAARGAGRASAMRDSGTRARRSTSGCCASPPARTTRSTSGWSPTTCARRSRTPRCSRRGTARRPTICNAIRDGARGARRRARARRVVGRARRRGRPAALETPADERIGAAGGRVHLGRSRNDQVLAALRLYLRDAIASSRPATAARRRARSSGSRPSRARSRCRATPTCSRRCRARSRSGRAASPPRSRDDAQASSACARARTRRTRSARPPATARRTCRSTASARRAALGFARTHEPVTAVQLSRGKAEATLLFEVALLMQDLGRLASDLLLFYTQRVRVRDAAGRVHDRLVDHAAEAQPRRLRAGARPQATASARLQEMLGSPRSCRRATSATCS